jgi:GntR family transcriptional repressor for pyruvate dehydrogenase complex
MDKIDYKVVKINLYEQIADTLEQAIVRSELKLEKLPSEQELSKRFNVSRTVIREALKVLKERGLIQSRNGDGSYISKPNTDTISSAINRIIQLDNISNDNLHGTRLILETAGARLAARYARAEDINELENILKGMVDESLPPDKRIRLDAEFHIAIARASGNELLRMFVEVMTILLKDYMVKGMSGIEGIKKTLEQHRKILEALMTGDSDLAEKAVQDHLVAARENVDKYEQKKK